MKIKTLVEIGKAIEAGELVIAQTVNDRIAGKSGKVCKADCKAEIDAIKATNKAADVKNTGEVQYELARKGYAKVMAAIAYRYEKTPAGKKAKADKVKADKVKAEKAKAEKEAKILQDAIDSGKLVSTEGMELETTFQTPKERLLSCLTFCKDEKLTEKTVLGIVSAFYAM